MIETLQARTKNKSEPIQFRPEFIFPEDKTFEDKLGKLLDDPAVYINDHIKDQLCELLKLKHPEKKLTKEELLKLSEEHTNGIPLLRYGVWVFYPWSNRLVHLLPENEFIEVRTSRNQYK